MSDQVKKAEHVLVDRGVFKGMGGLRGLLEHGEFWAQCPYGTRFYYGRGGGHYLHHSVLKAAVDALDDIPRLESENERLRARIKRLEVALRFYDGGDIARAALEDK